MEHHHIAEGCALLEELLAEDESWARDFHYFLSYGTRGGIAGRRVRAPRTSTPLRRLSQPPPPLFKSSLSLLLPPF